MCVWLQHIFFHLSLLNQTRKQKQEKTVKKNKKRNKQANKPTKKRELHSVMPPFLVEPLSNCYPVWVTAIPKVHK